MLNILLEIFKKYGFWSIIGALILAISVWFLADYNASPGTEVSVLWGLAKYTKSSSKSDNQINNTKMTIKIFDNITSFYSDSMGAVVNKKYAPGIVIVKGTVSNAMDAYVYLIVDDIKGLWIQSGLGERIDNDFSGICYLGRTDDSTFLNRPYTVSAVITNTKYQQGEILDRSTVLV